MGTIVFSSVKETDLGDMFSDFTTIHFSLCLPENKNACGSHTKKKKKKVEMFFLILKFCDSWIAFCFKELSIVFMRYVQLKLNFINKDKTKRS